MTRLIALVLLGTISAACIGDRSHDVLIKNVTDIHLTVYPYGQKEARFKLELGPGESMKENLLTTDTNPGGYVTIVEAVSDDGRVVFCHRFTYGELTNLNWQVNVTARTDCS